MDIKEALYLCEVFIKLWVEQSHLRLHVLVQNQREHRKHGVDGGIPAKNRERNELHANMVKYIHTSLLSCEQKNNNSSFFKHNKSRLRKLKRLLETLHTQP